jgi:hypothetical protein
MVMWWKRKKQKKYWKQLACSFISWHSIEPHELRTKGKDGTCPVNSMSMVRLATAMTDTYPVLGKGIRRNEFLSTRVETALAKSKDDAQRLKANRG